MKKLRAMTDRAIIELIRDRIAGEQAEGEDGTLAAAVAQRAQAEHEADD